MSGVEARDRKSQPQGKKILHKQEQGQEWGKMGIILCVCVLIWLTLTRSGLNITDIWLLFMCAQCVLSFHNRIMYSYSFYGVVGCSCSCSSLCLDAEVVLVVWSSILRAEHWWLQSHQPDSSGKHAAPAAPASHTHSTSISIFALSFFLSGLFLFIPDVCFIPPALICSHVSRCSPGWIHKGLIARDVSLSARLSFHLFSGSCFIAAVHFSPPHSLRAPACLSLCHFNLHSLSVCACQSFPSSLLFCFHHSSVFSAEVSADSSHIFFPTALLSLPPLILPAPHLPVPYFHAWSKSDNTSSAPPPTRKKKVVSTRTQHKAKLFFFPF